MAIYLNNTLTGRKEEFIPLSKNNIRIYACGPTVYDRPHLGNARAAVVYDLLFRMLSKHYPKVTYVRNITDVDDKIIDAAIANNQSIAALTQEMTAKYHEDVAALNCLSPTNEPRATQHIDDMIGMIGDLLGNGFAYEIDGHVLFDVQQYSEYGQLANRSVNEMIEGSRVEIAPFKKNACDFVLWKPAGDKESKLQDAAFESPWGRGRPGWHIECSAMSKHFLGVTFDIHGGGADLKFPHHENEVAQSCCANGTDLMARYWVHNGFLTIDGEKMSKSLKNFTTVREVLDSGVNGNVIRYFYLTTHYKKPIDFNPKALSDAAKAVEKFSKIAVSFQKLNIPFENKIKGDMVESNEGKCSIEAEEEALEYLSDDLNTPKVLALAHSLAAEAAKGDKKAAQSLCNIMEMIGVELRYQTAKIPQSIKDMAEERKQARLLKEWQKSDLLRQEILKAGFMIKDLPHNEYELRFIAKSPQDDDHEQFAG